MQVVMKKLYSKGLFHIFGSSLINKIIGFSSSFILVRILEKSDYGIYSYANNLLSIFLIFSGLGVVSGILQFGSENLENNDKKNSYINLGVKIGGYTNIILSIVIIVMALSINFSIDGSNRLIILMALIPLAKFPVEIYQMIFRINMENKIFSKYNTLGSLLLMISSVTLGWGYGAKGVIIATYLSNILLIIIGYYFSGKRKLQLKGGYKLTKVEIKEFLNISMVSCFNNGVSQLLYTMDILLIGYFIMDEGVIASYKTATMIPFALSFIPLALMTYIYPHFASKNKDKRWIKKNYIKLLKYFGGLNILISGGMFIFAEQIVNIFFGEIYVDSVDVFRILAIGYFFSATFRIVSGNILLMLKKVKFNFYMSIASGLLNIVLNILLITYFGSMGAAIATVIIFIVSGGFSTIYIFYILRE